jgi:putative transcriptional regulator
MTNRLEFIDEHFEGCILVASPTWRSEMYGQSVCLLVHHGKDGSVGIFLNRSFPQNPAELWKHLVGENVVAGSHRRLHFGGPVSGPVIALHNQPELAEYTTVDGVYMAAQLENLQRLILSQEDAEVRIIVGQAAWKPGELDAELRDGKWLPIPVSPQLVFSSEDEMWSRAMRQIGNHFVVAISGATGQPASILLN